MNDLWWTAGCWTADGPSRLGDARRERWESALKQAATLLEPGWAAYTVHGQREGLRVVALLLYAGQFRSGPVDLAAEDVPLPDLLHALDQHTVDDRIATGLQELGHDLDDAADGISRAYQALTYTPPPPNYDSLPADLPSDSVPVSGPDLLHGAAWAQRTLIRHHLLELSVDQ